MAFCAYKQLHHSGLLLAYSRLRRTPTNIQPQTGSVVSLECVAHDVCPWVCIGRTKIEISSAILEQDFAPLRAHKHLRLAKPASEPQTSMESLRKACTPTPCFKQLDFCKHVAARRCACSCHWSTVQKSRFFVDNGGWWRQGTELMVVGTYT